MAQLHPLEIILEFEPIVKLVCENMDCQFNLANASNTSEGKQAACNLKQITIDGKGHCQNFEKIKDNNITKEINE